MVLLPNWCSTEGRRESESYAKLVVTPFGPVICVRLGES